jgi:hypothetical protein
MCPSKVLNITIIILLQTVKYLDVANYTTPLLLLLLLLLLLISCKLSFPIVGLEMSSLPTLALRSNKNLLVFRKFV